MGRLARVAGAGLVGYGGLILLQVVPHEAPLAGVLSLTAGAILLLAQRRAGVSRRAAKADLHAQVLEERGDRASPFQRRVVRAIGLVALLGVVGYNQITRSDFAPPELAIGVYGLLLLLASFHLDRSVGRVRLGALVAWSFPLVLAPLGMYAINALLSADAGQTAAIPLVHHLIVVPTAFAMQLMGSPVDLVGNNMVMATPRGTLVLGVGLVCAGLYPMVLFGGIVALHAWQQRIGVRRFLAYLTTGWVALWFLNVVRLVALAHVGKRWGALRLQEAHAHLGWVLFALFMVAFWFVVLRRIEAPPRADAVAEQAP